VAGFWHGYVSGSRCRFAYGPADATATHYLLLQYIQIDFTFLLPAHWVPVVLDKIQEGKKWLCVCVLMKESILKISQHLARTYSGTFFLNVV